MADKVLINLATGIAPVQTVQGWLLIAYLGLVPSALAYWMFQMGLRTVSATAASIIGMLDPLVAALLAWVLFSETLAIKKALGETAYEIPISSTKSVTGHLMGAAGSVEAVFSIMAICNNFVPPTVNLESPDPACDLDYIAGAGRSAQPETIISNSFGFGGINASLVMRKH